MNIFIKTSIYRIQRTDIDDTNLSRRVVVLFFFLSNTLLFSHHREIYLYRHHRQWHVCLDSRNA